MLNHQPDQLRINLGENSPGLVAARLVQEAVALPQLTLSELWLIVLHAYPG
jgi:hypothetical protein